MSTYDEPESDDPEERAYFFADRARANLLQLAEDIPRLEEDGDWSEEAIKGVNKRLEQIEESVRQNQGDMARVCNELDTSENDGGSDA